MKEDSDPRVKDILKDILSRSAAYFCLVLRKCVDG